jgi:hypothetical protein
MPFALILSRRAWIFSRSVVSPVSTVTGVGHMGFKKFRGERPAERSATAFVLLASGVGNNPYPVSSVRCTNGTRRNAMPFRIIPDRGQVSENNVQPSTKQRCHVLQDSVLWSNQANGSNDFPVESRTGSGQTGADPGKGNILTWESGCDNIGFAFLEVVGCHVAVAGDAGEILGKHGLRMRLHFAERDGLETASPFEAKAKAADAAEKIENAKLRHRSPSHRR